MPVQDADAYGARLGSSSVAALVLFGWRRRRSSTIAPIIVQLADRRPLIRTLFNAGVFGLVGNRSLATP